MESEMNITDQQAKESLEMIQQTTTKIKKAKASSAGPFLILWGILMFIAYGMAHFYLQNTGPIFRTMGIVGWIGTGAIVWWEKTKGPVKDTSSNTLDKKMSWFVLFLALYIAIWLMLLPPVNGYQLNVVIVTGVMFAYVVMGLFYEIKLMIILGIFVTAVTLLAHFFFSHYFCLVIAIFGGGALLATGIYMRLMWR